MDGQQLGQLLQRQLALDVVHAVLVAFLRGAQLLQPHDHALRRRLVARVADAVSHLRERHVAHVDELVEQLGVVLAQLVELALREREQHGVLRGDEARFVAADGRVVVVLGGEGVARVAPVQRRHLARFLLERGHDLAFVDVVIVQVVDGLGARADVLALEELFLLPLRNVVGDLQPAERLVRYQDGSILLLGCHGSLSLRLGQPRCMVNPQDNTITCGGLPPTPKSVCRVSKGRAI